VPSPEVTWAAFRFNSAFVDQYRVVAKGGAIAVHSSSEDGAVSTVRATAATLAKLAQTEPQTVSVALSHIFRRLGEVLAARDTILIDCRVGSLIGDKNGVEFVFHHLPEPSAEDKPRPDANLLRKGMRPLKTRLANETRALRSKYRLQSPPRGRSIDDTKDAQQFPPGCTNHSLPHLTIHVNLPYRGF
jgi:hypothetical protein